MEIRELLHRLDRHCGSFPSDLLAQATSRRDEIVPELLRILETIDQDPQPWLADESRFIHIHSLYLLAFFRETRAYPLIVRIFARPGEFPFELAGDIVTQDLSRILASVSGGDLSGIKRLIEDEQVNEWVRSSALGALEFLVIAGEADRDEAMAYIVSLFGKLERKPSALWDEIAFVCADLWPQEAFHDLRCAYDEKLVWDRCVGWDEIERALALGKEEAIKCAVARNPLITDIERSMKWMQNFQPPRSDTGTEEEWEDLGDFEDSEDLEDEEFEDEIFNRMFDGAAPDILDSLLNDPPEGPIRRTTPKVGRNELCPCGSGKKYKKCCGVQ